MNTYLNKSDREHHMLMLALWDNLSGWLKETKCLTPQERKRIKTAATHLLKTSDSLVGRLDRDYAVKVIKDLKALQIRLSHKFTGEKDMVRIEYDKISRLAEFAQEECLFCERGDFKECERFKVLVDADVAMGCKGEGCPYRR